MSDAKEIPASQKPSEVKINGKTVKVQGTIVYGDVAQSIEGELTDIEVVNVQDIELDGSSDAT